MGQLPLWSSTGPRQDQPRCFVKRKQDQRLNFCASGSGVDTFPMSFFRLAILYVDFSAWKGTLRRCNNYTTITSQWQQPPFETSYALKKILGTVEPQQTPAHKLFGSKAFRNRNVFKRRAKMEGCASSHSTHKASTTGLYSPLRASREGRVFNPSSSGSVSWFATWLRAPSLAFSREKKYTAHLFSFKKLTTQWVSKSETPV